MVYYRFDRQFPMDLPQYGEGYQKYCILDSSILYGQGAAQGPEENKTSQERNQYPWGTDIEGRYNGKGTDARAKKIDSIHAMGLLPGGHQYNADNPACEEEWQGHDHVGDVVTEQLL